MIPEGKYFESHVTIEPVFGADLEDVKHIASWFGFKVADLLIKKRKEDTAERSANDTFCTARDKDFDKLKKRMRELQFALWYSGYKIWRAKIEWVFA